MIISAQVNVIKKFAKTKIMGCCTGPVGLTIPTKLKEPAKLWCLAKMAVSWL